MVEIFLKLNVALIGHGKCGDFFDNRDAYRQLKDGYLIEKLAEEIQGGDILVLKHIESLQTKVWRIYVVGEVVSPYRYEPILTVLINRIGMFNIAEEYSVRYQQKNKRCYEWCANLPTEI